MKRAIQYIVHIYDIDSNTAATIVITIFIFLLGLLLTFAGNAFFQFLKKSNYRRSLKLIIADFFNSCKKQSILFESFELQNGFLNGSDYLFSYTHNYTQNYLVNLDLESFTNNFSSILINRKIKTQAIFKLFEQVGVISKETTLIKDYIDKILDRYSSHENDYNTSLGELRIFLMI